MPIERVVVRADRAEQLVVALVAAEDRVRQVEEHDRGLGEVRVALVLEPAPRDDVAGGRGLDDVILVERALRRDIVDDRLPGERLRADARAAVPRRALPEPLRGRVRVLLGRLEPILLGEPLGVIRGRREVGPDARPIERLGGGPQGLRAEPERLALVARQRPAVRPARPREDGQDRDVLPELAQARDQPAARQGDIVRMGSDEHVGHRRPSISAAR